MTWALVRVLSLVAMALLTMAQNEPSVAADGNNLVLTAAGKVMFAEGENTRSLDDIITSITASYDAKLEAMLAEQKTSFDTQLADQKTAFNLRIAELETNFSAQLDQVKEDLMKDTGAVDALRADVEDDFAGLVHTVEAQSAGLCDGNFFNVRLDGELIQSERSWDRGINMFELDLSGVTPMVTKQDNFDTCCGGGQKNDPAGESARLVAYIEGLAEGTVVVFGIIDEGVNQLSTAAREALATMGAYQLQTVTYRESWVMIGIKGSAVGSVAEDHGGEPAQNCEGGGRPTKNIKQVFFGGSVSPFNAELVREKLRDQSAVARLQKQVDLLGVDHIKAQSSGICDGNFFRVWLNNDMIEGNVGRGINTVRLAFDKDSVSVIERRTFDTCCGDNIDQVRADMTAYLNGLPDGTVVIMGILDEGVNAFTEELTKLVESYGSQYIRTVTYRESWVMVGIKGAAIGSVAEDHGGQPASDCSGGGRPTIVVQANFFNGEMF